MELSRRRLLAASVLGLAPTSKSWAADDQRFVEITKKSEEAALRGTDCIGAIRHETENNLGIAGDLCRLSTIDRVKDRIVLQAVMIVGAQHGWKSSDGRRVGCASTYPTHDSIESVIDLHLPFLVWRNVVASRSQPRPLRIELGLTIDQLI